MGLNYYAIGQRIKKARKQQHLSQLFLSEMIDKSPTYISYIENGSKGMSLDTFVHIANALEVPTDILLSEQLRYTATSGSQELTILLSDCSSSDREIIISTVKALKAVLREQRQSLNYGSR